MDREIKALVASEQDKLRKLKEIVNKTLEDEKLILDNLMHPPADLLTRGQQVSDRVAKFGGSWSFIILFVILLIVWITYNSLSPRPDTFDPYPFILMNLILSCVAALQAPIIMMSQNRQEEKDRKRSENDYLINLKAELEIRALHEKIDLLLEDQIKILFESQANQLEILKRIEKSIHR